MGNDPLEESTRGKGRLPGNVKESFERCGGNFEMSPVCTVVCKGQRSDAHWNQGHVGSDQRWGSAR